MKAAIIDQPIDNIPEIKNDLRLYNCLKRAEINTVEDIIFTDIKKLNDIKNFGQKLKQKLQKILDEYRLIRIGQKNFENGITTYIKEKFPYDTLETLNENIEDSELDNEVKQILKHVGLKKVIDLTAEKTQKILYAKQYSEIKRYLKSKNLITYENRLYPYFVKEYENQMELNNKYKKLEKENTQLKGTVEKNNPKLEEYNRLLKENEELMQTYEAIKEAIKKKTKLKKEIEANKRKIQTLKETNDKLDQELFSLLTSEGIIHGTK